MKTLENIERYILYIIVSLFPLAVVPVFPNNYETVKLSILVYGIILILILKSIRALSSGNLSYSSGSLDLPLFLLAAAALLSGALVTPNKMEAFFLPGSASFLIGGVLLYFIINQLSPNNKKALLLVLTASAAAVSLVSLLAFLGVLSYIPQLPELYQQKLFNTVGSPLLTAIFIGAFIPLSIYLFIKEETVSLKIYALTFLTLILIALGILIYHLFAPQGAFPTLPDLSSTWTVAIDTLKEKPLLGIGPGNYLTAFNRFRPLAYNLTDSWNVRFVTASNFYLTLLTEVGLIGFAALAMVFFWLAKSYSHYLESAGFVSLFTLSILLAIFPPAATPVVTFFILLAITSKASKSSVTSFAARLPLFIVTAPVILGSLFLGYYSSNLLSAEATFKKSLDALARNEARTTYDLMLETIRLSSYVDRYHSSFAQVNMALARSISKNENLNEEDRKTISQLIQQAINEAKAGVFLNPQRSQNWQILAEVYREIMAFAQGADAFAIQSYKEAIALDPVNPNLRITLGGIFYSLGRYDEAIDAFKLATLAKGDFANAHYNLAIAYREKGEIERAISEMQIVLTLIPKDSSDYQLAQGELESLEKNRPAKELEEGESLTPPKEAEQVITPPIPFPEAQ